VLDKLIIVDCLVSQNFS